MMRKNNLVKRFLVTALASAICLSGCAQTSSSESSLGSKVQTTEETSVSNEINESECTSTEDTEATSKEEISESDATEVESTAETETDEETTEETETETDVETETEPETGEETTEKETTKESTTAKPTTEAPSTSVTPTTTETPTTVAPTTKVEPTTVPTTVAPTTVVPTTEAPKPASISAKVSGSYYVGDTIPASAFTVIVTMSDGSRLTNPAGWGATPLSLSDTSNIIKVVYGNLSTTITVNANTKPVETKPEPTKPQETKPQETTPANKVPTPMPETGVYILPSDKGTCHRKAGENAFNKQNELRVSRGLPPFEWDEELYQYAVAAATAIGQHADTYGLGSAQEGSHNITAPYRTAMAYNPLINDTSLMPIPENLAFGGCPLSNIMGDPYNPNDGLWWFDASDFVGYVSGLAISPGHKEKVLSEKSGKAVVAVYITKDGASIASFLYLLGGKKIVN